MAWKTRDTTSDRQEVDDITAGTTAPVAPSGGTQPLAGSPTYDAYANTQMGRLSRIVALHAEVSESSISQMLAERLAEPTCKTLESDSHLASIEVIGLRPLAKNTALASVGGPVSADLQKVIDVLSTADGVILVSPVFQVSYSGLFKFAVDVLSIGTLEGVSVLLGMTVGTARHSLVTEVALRPLMVYMKALPTQTAVFTASEGFGTAWQRPPSSGRPESSLSERVAWAGRELATLMERFPCQAPVDPLTDFAPMEMLLTSRWGREPRSLKGKSRLGDVRTDHSGGADRGYGRPRRRRGDGDGKKCYG